jgi:CRP-like cAMP-binding protein
MLTRAPRPPPMTTDSRPGNKILGALPQEEFDRLRPKLREESFNVGTIVYQPEEAIESIYFINRGIVSWLATLEDGNTVEAGVIGPEGLAGVSALLGAKSTPNQGLAQSDVEASRIATRDLIGEFRQNGELNRLILRFVHSMFTQVAQTAACNRLHTLDQRLARWLLMSHDRSDRDGLPLTQEFLSRMLGVRRAGVSVSANSLRQNGLIDYRRGDIQIIDRRGLEAASCECYQIVKDEYEQSLLPSRV